MGVVTFLRPCKLPSFEVFRRLTTEKHWRRPCTLPGIAYRFELKGGVSLMYVNENEEQP